MAQEAAAEAPVAVRVVQGVADVLLRAEDASTDAGCGHCGPVQTCPTRPRRCASWPVPTVCGELCFFEHVATR